MSGRISSLTAALLSLLALMAMVMPTRAIRTERLLFEDDCCPEDQFCCGTSCLPLEVAPFTACIALVGGCCDNPDAVQDPPLGDPPFGEPPLGGSYGGLPFFP